MDLLPLTLLLLLLLFAALGSGVLIALALAGIGLVAILVKSAAGPVGVFGTSVWSASVSWDLTALPMFIWMGEILYRTKLSEDLFEGLAPWLSRLPGRLLHVNVVGCGIFAAVSGSSAATCATIGRIALPELAKRGYDERMAIGTLAGSGTLGLLIPPSIIMIVYGAATEQSIARLFIAGVIPGILLALLFMGFVAAWALLNPSRMPPPEPISSFANRIASTRRLIPVILLIAGVIGSIYGGLASATEAAVVGVFLSLALSWGMGTLTRSSFRDALLGATRTSCMIAFILAGAAFLTSAMGFTGIPRALAEWITSLGLAQWQLLIALTVFYMLLGCFLDGISMVVLTTSIIMPLVEKAGFDLIWFGIYVVLVVEMAQITPPVGFNLFVLQGMTGRNIFRIGYYALPFFLLLGLAVILLVVFPGIALWLPSTMFEG
ncbi:TRAP transporter large permease [Aquabacter spiritensis]|uniref:TRAP transporter large permease protein n=1 Tax=Aquabacter spiritensis TaxID=933073 RepID=A0A4R3M1Z3_9HYPH|nr:TRAP transporter large permease subunit [Aquabacter spiritensis]TCT05125.1 tripartite ATP-independent transporter DctM subunit [Aquabacter spiritensis]